MDIKIHQFDPTTDGKTLLFITVEQDGKLFQKPVTIMPTGEIFSAFGSEVKGTVSKRITAWKELNPKHKYKETITL